MDILDTLKQLTSVTGVSGAECGAAESALGLLKKYAPDASIDASGNVTGLIRSGVPGAKTLMLDAHIDQIGLIVTYIDKNGFLKVGSCGCPDLKIMLAQSVTVHGSQELRGVISTLPPHVSPDHSKVPEAAELSVDIGMTKEQAEKYVAPGDRITVDSAFRTLSGDAVSAPSVDDRSGVCAILAALDMMDFSKLKYDLAVCFSAPAGRGNRRGRVLREDSGQPAARNRRDGQRRDDRRIRGARPGNVRIAEIHCGAFRDPLHHGGNAVLHRD